MSVSIIEQALLTRLSELTPAIPTAWPNIDFQTPGATTAYQKPFVLFATPDDQELGARHTQSGVLKVKLFYPSGVGQSAMLTRAELIRQQFKKSTSLPKGGLVVNIFKTPEIIEAGNEDGRFVGVVTIFFTSHIEG